MRRSVPISSAVAVLASAAAKDLHGASSSQDNTVAAAWSAVTVS